MVGISEACEVYEDSRWEVVLYGFDRPVTPALMPITINTVLPSSEKQADQHMIHTLEID